MFWLFNAVVVVTCACHKEEVLKMQYLWSSFFRALHVLAKLIQMAVELITPSVDSTRDPFAHGYVTVGVVYPHFTWHPQ